VQGASEHGLRFVTARAMKMAQLHLSLAMRLSPDALAALVAAFVRQSMPDFHAPDVDPAAVSAEAARLQRAVPRKLLAEINTFALECAGVELRQISAGVAAAADRAGLLAAGVPGPALQMLEKMGLEAAARALAVFAVGDELPELRRIVGTSIG